MGLGGLGGLGGFRVWGVGFEGSGLAAKSSFGFRGIRV